MDNTNFYTQQHSDNFVLSNYKDLELRIVWTKQDSADTHSESDIPYCKFDRATYLDLCKKLIQILDIDKKSNQEIHSEHEEKYKESSPK